MANYDKWTKGATGHLCKHFERAKGDDGEYVKFGNRDIDPSRTHLNYNLAPERKSQHGFIVDRCKELKCLNRKDVNVLSSWIVTAPVTLPDNKLQDFFQASYDALEKKYGKENVVSAYVHMDESGRPHMHFAFVPVVWNDKKGTWKVSAKECVTRTDLQQFHPWLEAELEQRLGFRVDVINEATKNGNKDVSQLKQEREIQKQAELAAETEEAAKRLAVVQSEVTALEDKRRQIEESIEESKKLIPDRTAYEEAATYVWSVLDSFKMALQNAFSSRIIFRNPARENKLLKAAEWLRDELLSLFSAIKGYEAREQLPKEEQRSKAIEQAFIGFDERIKDAQERSRLSGSRHQDKSKDDIDR